MLGYEKLPIKVLDSLAMAIPAVFVLMSIMLDHPYTYARALFSFAFMEVLKGFVDWITVVPDSNGWAVCKDRLQTSTAGYNVSWYAQKHDIKDIFVSELHAPTGRFCSDMMLSGHTQAVIIFGLALFESVTITANRFKKETRDKHYWKFYVAMRVVAAVVILQQMAEVYFVLKSRFHYSSDIFMALVVSYLVYTSSAMAWLGNKWIEQGFTWWKSQEDDAWKKLSRSLTGISKKASVMGINISEQLLGVEEAFESPWMQMFRPRMIQLGCCCCPESQLYLVNYEDLLSMFKTAQDAMEAAKTEGGVEEGHFTLDEQFMRVLFRRYHLAPELIQEFNKKNKNIFPKQATMP
jgi:hypothetical protein